MTRPLQNAVPLAQLAAMCPVRAPVVEEYTGPGNLIIHNPDQNSSRQLTESELLLWELCSHEGIFISVLRDAIEDAASGDETQKTRQVINFVCEMLTAGFIVDSSLGPDQYSIPVGYELDEGFSTRTGMFETFRAVAEATSQVCWGRQCEIVHLRCGCGSFIRLASDIVSAIWNGVDTSHSAIDKARCLLSGEASLFHVDSLIDYPWVWQDPARTKLCIVPMSIFTDSSIKLSRKVRRIIEQKCDMALIYTLFDDWLSIDDLAARAKINLEAWPNGLVGQMVFCS
jgi:hypothetical protein